MTRGLGLAAAIAVVAALAVPAASAAPQQAPVKAPAKAAAKKAKPEDFNGDGYRDLVVSAASATVNGKAKAGYAAVLYGSKSGSLTAKKQIINQDSAGIADSAEAGDRFGTGLATGDFDGDGYTDLAIGAPGEDVGQTVDAGSVTVVWGGKQGLAGSTVVRTGDQEDIVPDPYEKAPLIGGALAAGDFDGDQDTDLVLSVQDRDLRQLFGPIGRDGAFAGTALTRGSSDSLMNHDIIDLVVGDFNKDGRADLVRAYYYGYEDTYGYSSALQEGSASGLGPDKSLGGSRFGGGDLAVGDVNGDRVDDLVIGHTHDGSDWDVDLPTTEGGMITWIPGKKGKGPIPARARSFNQDSAGVPGVAEGHAHATGSDRFGAGLSAGDVNGDGFADIAVGVPSENFDGIDDAGSVIVMRGTKDGPTGKGSKLFSQNTKSVPGAAENDDFFGYANKLVDVDGDKKADLITGALGENKDAGAVWVFKSAKNGTGPAAKGSVTFGAGTLGAVAAGGHLGGGFAD